MIRERRRDKERGGREDEKEQKVRIWNFSQHIVDFNLGINAYSTHAYIK